jgi:hypothetical protein
VTSAAELLAARTIDATHPKPLQSSLVAAARRVTATQVRRFAGGQQAGREWQDESWNMYDLVGELHYLTTTLAGRMGQARLFVGTLPDDDTQAPQQVTDGPAAVAFDALSNANGRQQMIVRLGSGLFIAGEGWIVGIPRYLLDDESEPQTQPGKVAVRPPPAQAIMPVLPPPAEPALEDLEWFALSVSEVTAVQGDKVRIHCGSGKDGAIEVAPEDVYLIRVWRPHPRLFVEADSPTRASLPVLRELTGLTMHVSAQVDSRLAGAGMLLVPATASAAVRQDTGVTDPGEDSDPLTDALIESMLTPIRDRSSASALVPLVVTVPDDSISAFRYLSFAGALDAEARPLREEAIRRLALGLDAPPEVLLGTAAQNHWGAWLVREDVVSTHLEPPLALICDALTTQYLQPVLVGGGMDPEAARKFVIWYDVSHLVSRPNRFADASVLHAKGVISDGAFRQAGGFADEDAPPTMTAHSAQQALQLIIANPHLGLTPGIVELAKQIAHLTIIPEDVLAVTPLLSPPPPLKGMGPVEESPPTPGGAPAPTVPETAPVQPGGPPPGGPPASPPKAPAGAP